VLAILATLAVCPLMAQQAQVYDDRPKITVNGEASVYVQPDKIVIALGIETWDMEIMAAKQKNNDILKKTSEVIRVRGFPIKKYRPITFPSNPGTKITTEERIFWATS
jgi:uncharacterized protein YggE